MQNKYRILRVLESILGRQTVYRVGRFLYFGARRELLNDPAINGEYALQTWILESLANRSGDEPLQVLDVGANLGRWSDALMKNANATALSPPGIILHAFEPAPDQFAAMARRFTDLIAARQVFVLRMAVGAEIGTVPFVVTGAETGNSAIRCKASKVEGDEIEVPVTTIDEYAKAADISEIALLKIDTEGNDFNVILGAKSMLEQGRIQVLQFEYNWRWIDFGHCLKSVFRFIHDSDYSLGLLTRSSIEIFDTWHPELDRYIEANYVLVRRDFLCDLPHAIIEHDRCNARRELQINVPE